MLVRTVLGGLFGCLLGSASGFHITTHQRSLTAAIRRASKTRHFSPTMAVKGILFDMDGTLTDSDSLHYECYRDTLLKLAPECNNGMPLDRSFYDAQMSGCSNDIIVPKLLPTWTREQMEHLWLSKETLYRERSVTMKPLEGVVRLMDYCDDEGIAKIIVTNAPRIDAEHTLKILGLNNRVIDVIVGEECTRPKPFPDPYLSGLAKLGLSVEDCIAFEDSFSGLASARAAGLKTIGVLTCRTEKDMLENGAFLTIRNFEDPALWQFLRG